jgi:integrase
MATTAKKRRSRGSGSIICQPSGNYAFQYIDANGKRKTKSLRTKNQTEAKHLAAEFEKIVQATDREEVLMQAARARNIIKTKDLPLDEVWAAFEKTNPSASSGTLTNYNRALRDFCDWLTDNRPSVKSWTQLDQETATSYLNDLWSTGLSANTYNYRRNALGHITKKLAPRYHIDANPWELTERKAETKQGRLALNAEQATLLLTLLDDPEESIPHREEMRVIAMLCMYAGMRLIDACLLKWHCIDLEAGKIEYTPVKTAKKGKTALVPTLPALRSALLALPCGARTDDVSPAIASTYRRNPDGIQKPLVKLVQTAAGTDGRDRNNHAVQRKVNRSAYGAHSLRHTFATMAAMAGAKPAYLARMLGDNITTVQKYYVHVGFGMELLPGFSGIPKMIEAKAATDPEREQLHRLADALPIESIRELLAMAGAKTKFIG